MATKVFCDGCDADMTDGKNESRKGLRINTTCEAGPGREILGQFEIGPFDLCGSCAKDRNWDKSFLLAGPNGVIECEWLDPHFGLFQFKGKEGFVMTKQVPSDLEAIMPDETAVTIGNRN